MYLFALTALMKKFRLALAGGTFDRLHAGHEKFLRAAFEKSQTVWIGLTSDWFAKKKEYGGSVEKYGERKSALVSFLKKNRLTRRSKIIKINGVAGPQAANPKVNAIIATGETLKGARKINALRRAAGVKPAKIELVEYVLAQDRKRISSTGVRQGRISRQGKVYLRRFESALRLPRRLIGAMRRPLGKLFCDGDYASAAR
jgi:pantetheine-phosphate adenylyltransferase